VITAADIAGLGAHDRLVLDLRQGDYRIDPSAGPVDLTRVDVVGPSGAVEPIAPVVARSVDAGRVTRDRLAGGMVVSTSGGLVVVFAVNDLTRVAKVSETSSTWWRSPESICSTGTQLLGMGSSQPSNGSILFRGMLAYKAVTGVVVGAETAAQEDLLGTTVSWNMTSFAMCGTVPGVSYVQDGTTYTSDATRTWTVSCPAGKKVLGGGGTIWQGDGRVKIDEIRPNETLDQVTVTASEDQDGTTQGWSLQVYAICATPPPGLVRVKAVAASGWDGRAVVASCPSEKRLLSVGGGVEASNRTPMRVFDLVPSSGLTSATARVTTKGSTSGITGEVRAYAICADG
jgi:hypothetical protein